jgi:hypothetical protein
VPATWEYDVPSCTHRRFSLTSLSWVDKLGSNGKETGDDPVELKKMYYTDTKFHGSYWGPSMTDPSWGQDFVNLAHANSIDLTLSDDDQSSLSRSQSCYARSDMSASI